jgi:two-component system, chemotaxis family, chemotaxis protein CheY
MATILIIDDDGDVLDTLALVLEEAGHTILTASSGADGARMFRDLRPDLVVTDMVMPRSDGIQAIQTIRGDDPAARIIAISGDSSPGQGDYLKQAMQSGAMAALPKPFEADEFLSIVNSCLAATPAGKAPGPPQ